VAIIGGGFSGCLVAVHLLRFARQPLRILMIERDDVPGRGVAYRDQPECHLLNVRAEAMSAFPDQPDHFLDWMNSSYSPCHPVGTHDFVPRRIYGVYIQWLLRTAVSDARRGVTLATRSDEAIAIKSSRHRWSIRLRSGGQVTADQVVLAIGNPGPANPPIADATFYSSRRYLANAWSTTGIYDVNRDENLLLIGSGLTTLDWLAALKNRNHRGSITVVSRRGLPPLPHAPTPAYTLSFDPLALPPRVSVLFKRLREEVRRAEAKGSNWRAVIDGLRPSTQALWQSWPDAEQRRFLRHARPFWEIHRHRAPSRLMDTMREMLASSQMKSIAGRLLDLHETETGVNVQIQRRLENDVAGCEVQRIINCTGPESNYRRLNHPLIASLKEQGLIHPDPLGLGVLTNASGALLDEDNQASATLFTLGPPRKGQLWETTAVPEIRVQAQALARLLLQETTISPSLRTTDALRAGN
jgi:uncharacterized NAD(P)/FAD-binding protein YdhS